MQALRAVPRSDNGRSEQSSAPLLLFTVRQLRERVGASTAPIPMIPRLAYQGRVTLLAGREKTGGKSTLMTAGVAAVTRGATFLDGQCPAGTVLWVTADQEHETDIAQRAERFGAHPDLLWVLWPRGGFVDLERALTQLPVAPMVVVIDTLTHFTPVADPFSPAEWPAVLMPLVRLARERELAVVINHHAKKNEPGGYRDSTEIGAAVDMLLEVRSAGLEPARRRIDVVARWPAESFVIELAPDGYRLVTAGTLSVDAQVLAFVTANPHSAQSAVRAAIPGKHREVDAALARLVAQGALRDVRTGRVHRYWPPQAAAEQSELMASDDA
jgi:AAA domain